MSATEENLVQLDEDLTIETAHEFKECLEGLADSGSPIRFDASQVNRIDTTGLQLLAAYAIGANEDGTQFTIESPSATILEVSTLLGMDVELGLASANDSSLQESGN